MHSLVPCLAATPASVNPDSDAPSTPIQQQPMNATQKASASIPPEIVRYLAGGSPESRQFDFLIGHWSVAARAFNEDGTVLRQYAAHWDAQSLNGGRMVMDDFRAQTPDGRDMSSFVTLRTWCESTGRWELTGLSAFQPAVQTRWHGQWHDGEMRLEASGKDPQGFAVDTRIRFFDIEPDRFAWESHLSWDGGKTWVRTASLVASRLPGMTQP